MLKPVSQKKSPRINIIPLIDIIFLMLVFFMLATNFSRNNEISFTLSNQKKVVNQLNKEKLMILNLKNDEIIFDDSSINLNDLEMNYLKKWRSLNYERIVILNDKRSSIQSLISLLDLIKKNKIKNVNFSNEPNKTPKK